MNNLYFSNQEMHQLVQNWYDASRSQSNSPGRQELFKQTENVIKFLEDNSEQEYVKDLCTALMNDFKNHTPVEKRELSEWIAAHTVYQVHSELKAENKKEATGFRYIMNTVIGFAKSFLQRDIEPRKSEYHDVLALKGAYEHFHHLYETVSKIKADDESDFAAIDKDSWENIKISRSNIPKVPLDITKKLFDTLSGFDLLAMRDTTVQNQEIADKILISQLNKGALTFNDLGIKTVSELIKIFGDKCKEITRLELSILPDDEAKLLAEYFPNLKHLDLAHCKNLEIFSFLEKLTGLETLIFESHDFKDLNFLAFCTNIKHLSIPGCERIVDFTPVSHLQKLESLDLEYCSQIENCDFLNHQNLKTLNLKSCSSILDLNFLEICKKIENLSIAGCDQINDFNPLGHLEKLKRLDIGYCIQGGNLLESVLKHCPDLTFLNLSYNTITNLELLKFCPHITELNLSNLEPESHDMKNSCGDVLLYCPDLKIIYLDKDIPEEQLQRFRERGIEIREAVH